MTFGLVDNSNERVNGFLLFFFVRKWDTHGVRVTWFEAVGVVAPSREGQEVLLEAPLTGLHCVNAVSFVKQGTNAVAFFI